MSAFYDLASLVVVPSGYKSGKIYAQKPLTTDGQLTFSRASTASRVNASGLIEEVASNVPRLDYTDSTCPKLLLEPQRTQILHRSTPGDFATSGIANRWVVGSATPAVENQAVGIFGTNTATRYTKTAGHTSVDFLYYSRASVVSGSTYTVSGYVKLGTATNAVIVLNDTTAWNTVPGANFVATAANGYSDWKRFSITFTAPVSADINIHIGYHNEVGVVAQNNGTFFLEGFQLELGSYETSLIPSTTAAVTRLADQCYKQSISSLIGQTEGTIYLEADIQKYNESGFYVAISTAFTLASSMYLYQPSSGSLQLLIRNTGNPDGLITINSANWTAGFNKVAIAYTATTAEVFINGASKGSTSFVSLPTLSQLTFGARPDNPGVLVGAGPYSQALVFKTRLTNAQLAELTSL
jgi:hypothetical protein